MPESLFVGQERQWNTRSQQQRNYCLCRSTEVESGTVARANSSIAIKTVTSSLTNRFSSQHASLSRALGLLLIVFILYGTTVEAAHCHGRISSAATTTAGFVDPVLTKTLPGTKTGCSDCLICQLHQNFTTTLITFRQSSPPVYVITRFSDTALIAFHSQTSTPRRGRAPPLSSLL